jgi:hypothetical protein
MKTANLIASQSEGITHTDNFLKLLIASRNTKGTKPFANPRQLNVKVKKLTGVPVPESVTKASPQGRGIFLK